MTPFNQKNQNVGGNQFNAEGNINIRARVRSADIPDELRDLLVQLGQAVEEMNKHLSKETIKETNRNLNTIVEGAVNKTPPRKWWSVSADGLEKAATNVGEIGKPILELLARIFSLL